ncbi:hypothetical protein PUR28_09780 [Streptomyces sp. BE308]|uniref:hypothetical protein n=1 Tax=Streptomyces sp. BE308 TaxID=3002529 RepID=UPI002E79D69B|nr:hypothetical protein [Streptomyces sp. BE308]MEE1791053.1 hypothetical protein [Streptomyces sp. BE308]
MPKGFEELDSGCWEDSGEAWVYAERTHAFPGDRTEVTRHYRVAAQRVRDRLTAYAGASVLE